MLVDLIIIGLSFILCTIFNFSYFLFIIIAIIRIQRYHLLSLFIIKLKDFLNFFAELRTGTYFKRLYGVYGIVGEYGQGKTIEMCRLYLRLNRPTKFHDPNKYIMISNFGLGNTLPFNSLDDVVCYYRYAVSAQKGLIVFWDEIQNEFPETDRAFPQAFRTLLTQNRKFRGVRFIWSTQDYTRVNKNLRLMTTLVTEMRCFFSRYMIASFYRRNVYEDYYNTTDINLKVHKRAFHKLYYIQSDKIRAQFDSFKMLDKAKSILGL